MREAQAKILTFQKSKLLNDYKTEKSF